MAKKKTDQEITDQAVMDAMSYGPKSNRPKTAFGMKPPDNSGQDYDNDGDSSDDTDDDGDGPDGENF